MSCWHCTHLRSACSRSARCQYHWRSCDLRADSVPAKRYWSPCLQFVCFSGMHSVNFKRRTTRRVWEVLLNFKWEMQNWTGCWVPKGNPHLVGQILLKFRVACYVRMSLCRILVALLWIYSDRYNKRVQQSCRGLNQDMPATKKLVLHLL